MLALANFAMALELLCEAVANVAIHVHVSAG